MRDTRWDIAKRGHEIPEFGRRFYANEIHTGTSPNVVYALLVLGTNLGRRRVGNGTIWATKTFDFRNRKLRLYRCYRVVLQNITLPIAGW